VDEARRIARLNFRLPELVLPSETLARRAVSPHI